MSEVRARVRAAGWDDCLVIGAEGVVLGRLGRRALARDDDVTAAEAMTLGPSTVRPSYELERAVDRMERQNLTSLPVTRPDGTLVGLLTREDAERVLASAALSRGTSGASVADALEAAAPRDVAGRIRQH
jgi:CBS domain-containing protein